MKRLFAGIVLTALMAIVTLPARAKPTFDPSTAFTGRQGCLIVYDRLAKRDVLRYNPQRCAERVIACSTFKVPLAVMAFDAGIIDESTVFPWDGSKYSIAPWNQDQTPATWMRHSAVWVSQLLTPKLGMPAIKRYLTAFDYGNQDMSGGLTSAWLTANGTPTLKVSADEQLRFLDRLYSNQLAASQAAQEATRRLVQLETLPSGAVLSGKTGSGLVLDDYGQPTGRDIGWFVGHANGPKGEYLVVMNFTDQRPGLTKGPGGFVARDLCRQALSALKLL